MKRYIAVTITIWLFLIGASAAWNVQQAFKNQQQIHLENGRSFFNLIVTMRQWNAEMGGVYVPVSEALQPNPYLDGKDRDITTNTGLVLTRVNPAYMTRLISEIADKKENVKFRITSLMPIRPDNLPADWEADALTTFEQQGQIEFYDYVEVGGSSTFRYMAPLVVEPSCMQCHAVQGYKVGDVRGGISVTFPAQFTFPWALIVSHIAIGLGGSGLIFVFGNKLRNAMHSLEDLSNRDGLTHIRNRRYFNQFLRNEYLRSRRDKTPLSVAICDIDDFKAYNDTYGHLAGDDCIVKVAQALQQVLKRPTDLVARYGGEEFGIILANTDPQGAQAVGELLRQSVAGLQMPHKGSKHGDLLTISIGFTTYIGDDSNENKLMEIADQAMYAAKISGKNRVVFHPMTEERVAEALY
ncbi:MAG: diguanylate cyclase [Anaerolineaceae bacterium]|nr:diguanylate cyclase [Anaerolineaceae bacterium]